MSKTEINPETGVEEVYYTQAELDAQKAEGEKLLAEKDAHVAQKLEEFQKGKTAAELKEIERENAVAEARRVADEAKATADATVNNHRTKVVDFVASQYVGADPELRKGLDKAFAIIEAGHKATGADIRDEKVIIEMMSQAANMAGLGGAGAAAAVFPMMGGMPPQYKQATEDEVSDAEHKMFLEGTGYREAKAPKTE